MSIISEIVIFVLFVLGGISFLVGSMEYEKYIWNGGVCRKNGIKWKKSGADQNGCYYYEAGDQEFHMRWGTEEKESKSE